MSDYRLRIDEIKGCEVVTSYTRWLESVEVRGSENQEIYLTFSPNFERIWLESKKHLPEYVAEKAHLFGAAPKSPRLGVGKGRGRKRHSRSSAPNLGELSSEGSNSATSAWPPDFVEPMKAKLVGSMPSGNWIYEIKFDGYRALALRGGSETRLLSRNQKDLDSKFPEVKDSIAALDQDAIIDGEIVALDEKDLAAALKLSPQALNEILSLRSRPSGETALRIESFLKEHTMNSSVKPKALGSRSRSDRRGQRENRSVDLEIGGTEKQQSDVAYGQRPEPPAVTVTQPIAPKPPAALPGSPPATTNNRGTDLIFNPGKPISEMSDIDKLRVQLNAEKNR